jgi:hypothetical protein
MIQKLFLSFALYIVGFISLFAQDEYTSCILIAEEKNYFTYVEPPLYFRSTPKENLVRTATINVTYNGFSAEAQTAFQFAVDILETEITSSVAIELIANWTPLGPGILGSAGANYIVRDFALAPLINTWYHAALANKLAGLDLYPSDHDINANFSSSFSNWYFGMDGNTPAGQYDFVSVVLHEIIHGLGFSGSMTVSGNLGKWGNSTPPIYPYIYDTYAVNGSGQRLLNTTLFPNPSVALGTELRSNNIFFDGVNAVIGNEGTNPKLYAPATWAQGSSYSHWDETTYPAGNINSLMTYAIGTAEAIHHPGYITRGLLKDIGWTINQSLPVELSSFTAELLKIGGVQLNWRTETEVNNYGFEIQRKILKQSALGGQDDDWSIIGFVEGNGNSNSPKEYSFADRSATNGKYSYRLKQIDNDGQFEYSNIIEIEIAVPNNFELSQNYPNPFNPSTLISFSIPTSGFVTLKIFDALGNEAATLVNEEKQPGVYEITWNAENISSGIYLYQLKAGNFTQTKKLILMK